MELYHETFAKSKLNNCYSSCSFVLTKQTITKDILQKMAKVDGQFRKIGRLMISFKQIIKVTDAYYLYSGLSLIAEIGGYVGLFLGVSVNQVSSLMNTLLDKIDWICNQKEQLI